MKDDNNIKDKLDNVVSIIGWYAERVHGFKNALIDNKREFKNNLKNDGGKRALRAKKLLLEVSQELQSLVTNLKAQRKKESKKKVAKTESKPKEVSDVKEEK